MMLLAGGSGISTENAVFGVVKWALANQQQIQVKMNGMDK